MQTIFPTLRARTRQARSVAPAFVGGLRAFALVRGHWRSRLKAASVLTGLVWKRKSLACRSDGWSTLSVTLKCENRKRTKKDSPDFWVEAEVLPNKLVAPSLHFGLQPDYAKGARRSARVATYNDSRSRQSDYMPIRFSGRRENQFLFSPPQEWREELAQ